MKVSQIAKNFVALLGSSFTVQGLRFLTVALMARRLGSDLFGVYSYVVMLTTYGLVIVEFGLKNVAIREISQGRGSHRFVFNILKIRLVVAGLAALVVMALSLSAFPHGLYVEPTFFIALSLFLDAFMLDYIAIAFEKLWPQALANVAMAVFMYGSVYLMVHSERDILLASQLFLISHGVWLVIFMLSVSPLRLLPKSLDIDKAPLKLALGGVPFLVGQFFGLFQGSLDIFLLGQFHYEAWLGSYTACLKILGVTLGIMNALTGAIQPRLAKHSGNLRSKPMEELLDHTMRLTWIFLVPTLIGSWLFSEHLVTLFFGAQYENAPILFKPLSLAMAFLCLSLPPLQALYVSSQVKVLLKVVTLNTAVTFLIIAGVLFYKHPENVAWAMAISQVICAFISWRPFKLWAFLTKEEFRTLPLPAILMTIPLLMGTVAPWIRFFGAVVGYTLGLYIMGIWKRPWVVTIIGEAK